MIKPTLKLGIIIALCLMLVGCSNEFETSCLEKQGEAICKELNADLYKIDEWTKLDGQWGYFVTVYCIENRQVSNRYYFTKKEIEECR